MFDNDNKNDTRLTNTKSTKLDVERSKREDLVYIEPDFEKMKVENPCLYSKYEAAQEALRCGALNIVETQ